MGDGLGAPKQKAKAPTPPPTAQTTGAGKAKTGATTATGGPGRPLAPSTLSNTARAAEVQAARKAQRQFESWEPRDLIVETKAVGPSSAACPLHACHAEPSKRLVFDLPPVELQGSKFFPWARDLIQLVWPKPYEAKRIPVRFGQIAKGYLLLYTDEYSQVWSLDGAQLLTFFHPALPPRNASETPALAIQIESGAVSGWLSQQNLQSSYVSPGPTPTPVLAAAHAAKLAGLADLQDLQIGRYVNVVENGQFKFELGELGFKFDGMFPGHGDFAIEKAKPLDAAADVEAFGIDKQSIAIERDEDAQLSAGKDLKVELKPPRRTGDLWSGAVQARFARGEFDIRGTLDYRSASGDIVGSATLLLTDVESAWSAVNQRLGDKAPVGARPPGSTGLALVGWGVLDFDLSKWLKGRAEVVVDPEGYITTLGRLEPTVTYGLFDKQTLPTRGLPGTGMDIKIPIAGELLHVDGGFSFKAEGWYGPGTLFDITIEGVYSTNPRIPTEFDVGATLAVPAQATLVLKIWGGIALGEGPISAGIRLSVTGTATLRAYAEAQPHIARRRVRDARDSAIEYAIHGHMDVAAALDVGLEGEIELHALTVKLASVDLGGHVWRIGNFGVRVNFDHVIGSGKAPNVSFEDVPFEDYKFMSAAVHGATREGEGKQAAGREAFENTPVRGELPAAHAPTPGAATTTPAPGTEAAGQLPAVQEQPLPPLMPGIPPPSEKAPFDMEGVSHTLWLVFDDPPTVFMTTDPEQLSKKLAVAVAEIRRQQKKLKKRAADYERSREDLEQEEKVLSDLLRDCVQVELNAARLAIHPDERLPKHVPGFAELAKRLHAYGDLYDRPDLISSVEAKAAPAYPAQKRPRPLPAGKTPRLDELEKIEPGVTERYASEYAEYLVNGGDQDLLTYVEGRAARKLGRVVEPRMIERYEKKHGVSSSKVGFEVVDEVTKKVGNWIPDIYVPDFSVGDIKDVKSQSLDAQMQADVLIAKGGRGVRRTGSGDWEPKRDEPLRFDLVVRRASHLRKRTHVTQPLQEAIGELKGRVEYWIPDRNEK